jgi:hypothetical protein
MELLNIFFWWENSNKNHLPAFLVATKIRNRRNMAAGKNKRKKNRQTNKIK